MGDDTMDVMLRSHYQILGALRCVLESQTEHIDSGELAERLDEAFEHIGQAMTALSRASDLTED